jgi:hypothetical protein
MTGILQGAHHFESHPSDRETRHMPQIHDKLEISQRKAQTFQENAVASGSRRFM